MIIDHHVPASTFLRTSISSPDNNMLTHHHVPLPLQGSQKHIMDRFYYVTHIHHPHLHAGDRPELHEPNGYFIGRLLCNGATLQGGIMVRPAGFEPATHSLEGCCSIQLS